MTEKSRSGWRWKVGDRSASERLGLLYEPGNWGDLLKDLWTAEIARRLARGKPGSPLAVLDPFAGRPHYPLTEAGARRFRTAAAKPLAAALEPFLARGEIPSTGRLAQRVAEMEGAGARIAVFDLDPPARRLWEEVCGARVLDLDTGYGALARPEAAAADLILLDPYDLFDRWREVLDPAAALARERPILLYIYNKSPRGGGFARGYHAFRRALAARLAPESGTAAALGRVPSDAALPRAYHEAILLGPAPLVEALRPLLESRAGDLAAEIARAGAGEDPARYRS